MSVDTSPKPDSEPRPRRWVWPVLGAALGVVLGIAVLSVFRPHVYSGVVLQSSDPAPSMEILTYTDGEPVDIAALQGNVVFVHFGFTYCPDVCPLTMATVNKAIDSLEPDDAQRVETIMVTVDPHRDSPAALDDYLANFDARFRGVWGEEGDVRSVATRYGVTFEYGEENADGHYEVIHTASLMAIDPDGALRIVYPFGVTAEELSADLQQLLN